MNTDLSLNMPKDISCRITRTLLMYVREGNNDTLGNLLDGLALDEGYLYVKKPFTLETIGLAVRAELDRKKKLLIKEKAGAL